MAPVCRSIFVAALLTIGACSDRAFTLRSTDPVMVQDAACVERTISSAYKNVEVRTDRDSTSAAASGSETRIVLFDQPDVDRFYSDPETRDYAVDWTPAGAKKAALSVQWMKRGEPISPAEREHVARRIGQVYRLLSAKCDLPATTIKLAER